MKNSPSPDPIGTMPLPLVTGGENLPRPLTSFIGRGREIAAISAMLAHPEVRMVTLTGPGGVGKTRLALQVADRSASIDTVWFVALASVQSSARVPAAIARAIGLRRMSDRTVERELVAVFGRARALLILDNVEQLPDAGKLVAAFLRQCPDLKVLATSRSTLRISGERVFAVPAMALPSNRNLQTATDLQDIETVRLFVERAEASSASFVMTTQNAPDVAEICRQMDGLPLAIELAAARIGAFSPADLRRRLADRMTLLAGGPGDEAPRHQSMRSSISWSYDLLAPDEQSVLAQLAIFAGPWTLEAAEAIVVLEPRSTHRSVMECVAALTQNNLVRRAVSPVGTSSYSMLETVRQFAKELLDARVDVGNIRDRHTDFIKGLARQAETAIYQNDGARQYDRVHVHLADVLHVLAHLEHEGRIDDLIDLSSELGSFWGMQGHVFEGRPWLEQAVNLGRTANSRSLGKAIVVLGSIVHMQGNEPLARAYVDEGLALIPQDQGMARLSGHIACGVIALRLGKFDEAASFQMEALSLVGSMPPAQWVTCAESTILGHLGNIAVSQGAIEIAKSHFDRALDRQTDLGFARGTSHFIASHPIAGLGDVARAGGDAIAALDLYQEALAIAGQFHDLRASHYAIGGVAGSLAAAGEWAIAATLFGACEHHHALAGLHFDLETMDRQRALGLPEPWRRASHSFGANQLLREAVVAGGQLPLAPLPVPEEAAATWSEGRELSLDEAIARALAARIQESPVDSLTGLSQREIDVLRLLVQGHTDREIAALLFITRRTASTHVRHIYDKVDVSSRAGATAWALRNGLA
ncbi:hypothetical protein BH24CHL3_BH24CHL3_00310 [soil metagenome]